MTSYESTFQDYIFTAELLGKPEVADEIRLILDRIPAGVRLLAKQASPKIVEGN